jgi:hypothetical protein
MNEDKIRKALKDYNANPADRAAQEVLQRQLGVYAVVARQPNGKVDVEETMENLAFALQTGETAQAGCIGVAELLAKPAPKIEADPVDGRPLRKGRTVTEPIVDWSAVPLARRRLVAFAAEVGQLPHSVAPCQSESVAAEVAQATLPPPWPRLEKKLAELEVSAAKGDRAARDAVEAVEARLCFRMKVAAEVRSALVAHATSTSNQTPVPLLVSQSPQRAEVRALIANLCRTDSEFESFVLDYFPDVKRQFGGGMSDTAKVTLLLTSVSAAEVTAALRAAYPRKFPAAANSRFSSTVSGSNTVGFWNLRPMPTSAIAGSSRLSRSMFCPNQAEPESGRVLPVITSIMVLFPAPFGPMMQRSSPALM